MEKTFFFDLHTDILTANKNLKNLLAEAINNDKSGYKAINAIFKGNLSLKKVCEIAKKATQNGLAIAFEDCSYNEFSQFKNGKNFSVEKLDEIVQLLTEFSPLYLSLCWNGENAFCSGCQAEGGLKDAGKAFIRALNQKKTVIDTAHANQKSFYEICENANRVICSHTAFYSCFAHKRNLTDEQIKLILSKKGIVGLISVGHFLTGAKRSISAYENAFYEHIDRYLQKFGANNLCLATDFYGSDAPVFTNGDYRFANRIKNVLLSKGYCNQEVEAILFKNAFNYFYG